MKRYASIFLMLVLATAARGQWVQTNGPCGGEIQSIVVEGTTVYAGTEHDGLYRSTDSGMTWSRSGLDGAEITGIVTSGTNMFVGTDTGVYRSTNNGTTWNAALPNFSGNYSNPFINCIAVLGNDVFAGTFDVLFRSSDNGRTWGIDSADFSTTAINALMVSGSTIFAATGPDLYTDTAPIAVMRSTDSGKSWLPASNGISNDSVASLTSIGNVLLAGTYSGTLFVSLDGGLTWSQKGVGLPPWVPIVQLDAAGSTVFAATSWEGIYRSTDSGNTWASAAANLFDRNLHGVAGNGNGLFVASINSGVFWSSDSGGYWANRSNGLSHVEISSFVASSGELLAAESSPTYRSSDRGITWTILDSVVSFDSSLVINAFASLGPVAISGRWWRGIYRSTDSGRSWQASNIGSLPFVASIVGVGPMLLASTGDGLYTSSDSGASWTFLNSDFANIGASQMLAIENNVVVSSQDSILYSLDGGASWNLASQGAGFIWSLVRNGTMLYAGTAGGGVFISTNAGKAWTPLTNSPTYVFSLVTIGNSIFAGTDSGIFLSSDNGKSWVSENQGLTNTSITTLEADDSDLYCATAGYWAGADPNGGVWRRPLSDFGISSSVLTNSISSSLEAYPNPLTHSTTLHFTSLENGYATVSIVNQLGVEVGRVFSGELGAGEHSFPVTVPAGLAAGMYECVIHMNGGVLEIPVLLTR